MNLISGKLSNTKQNKKRTIGGVLLSMLTYRLAKKHAKLLAWSFQSISGEYRWSLTPKLLSILV